MYLQRSDAWCQVNDARQLALCTPLFQLSHQSVDMKPHHQVELQGTQLDQ